MRAALQAVWVAFALLTAAAVGPATADESADVRKIIESRNAQLEQFYRTGQIDRVVASFAPDARQYPNHMPPLVGRDAIRAFWTQAAASGTWVFTLKTEAVEARAISRSKEDASRCPSRRARAQPGLLRRSLTAAVISFTGRSSGGSG